MTDSGITLNIYNKPTQIEGNQNDNNNQSETNLNINDNYFADNLRIDSTSAPRANNLQTIDNTRNESVETIENNQSSLPHIPQQNQKPPMPIYGYQTPPVKPIMDIPTSPSVTAPYKNPYNQYYPYPQQVIIIQQDPNQQQGHKENDQTNITQDNRDNNNYMDLCGYLAECCKEFVTCWCLCPCFRGGERERRGR